MIPKFRVWLPDPDVEKMLRVKALIFENDKTRCMCGYAYDFYLEDEDATIMQSTGLLDKNGKEIFEGDILKVANNDSSWFEVVKYDHEKAMFISKEVNLKYEVPETTLYDLFSPYPFKVEVIGNIWENPDLLGTKLGSEE